jgi:membrane-associated protease RseP (regulator of RpoE activity)
MLGVFVVLYSLGSLLLALKTGFDPKIFLLIISGGIILGITMISFVVLTYLNGEMYNAIAAFNL